MKITIIKNDNIVGIDGVFIQIDLSALPANLRAVQWLDNRGFEEWTDRENTQITDTVTYSAVLDAWQVAKNGIDQRIANPYYGMSRSAVLGKLLAQVDDKTAGRQLLPFLFNGAHFYPDTEFIQGMFSAITAGLLPADHVESWKTADCQPDGISNIYIDLDAGGIVGLALAYLLNKKRLWLEGDQLKRHLKDIYLDDTKTIADLLAVDITLGD